MENNDKNKKELDTFPELSTKKNAEILDNFYKSNEGIEQLWKKIEKNENDTKQKLFKAEKDLIDLTSTLAEACMKIYNISDIDSNIKTDYENMIKGIYNNDEKRIKNFIKKFPNWSLKLGKMIEDSYHFKRISNIDIYENQMSKESKRDKFKFLDISTKDSNIGFNNRKNKTNKATKALKIFAKLFTGKASKSKIEGRVKEFFKRVNTPWRMWWEVVCNKTTSLSLKEAKDTVKGKLNNAGQNIISDPARIIKCFSKPFNNGADLGWSINETNDGLKNDNNNAKRNQMLDVFVNLDKQLGNQARIAFGLNPVKEKSLFDKVKGLFTGSKPELKRTNSMGGLSNRPNLNESEQNITNINEPAPQASGSNLNFNQDKVDEINKILSGVQDNGTGGTVGMLQSILHKVNPDKKGKYDTKTGRRHDLLLPLAKYLNVVNDKAKAGDVDKYCKDQPDENWNAAEKLVCKVRNVVIQLGCKKVGYGLPDDVNKSNV